MKFFYSNRNTNILKTKKINLKKNNYINYLFIFGIHRLHRKFISHLFDFLYYNNSFKLKKQGNTAISNVIPFLLNGGNSFKNSILFFNLFAKFYEMSFNNSMVDKFNNYKYYKEFFYNFNRYNNYKNLNYLISWIFSWMQPMFYIECSVVPKKYRKKLKKKYLYKVKYLNKNKRFNKALNWITKYSNTIKNYHFLNRQLLVYLDLLLNYKNSYLYNKKILVYKKVFKL